MKNDVAPEKIETLQKISDEVGLSEKAVKEILQSGFHNMQFVDFYRSYADEDSEESREDVTCDHTFEPCLELIRSEKSEAVFGTLDELSYREREVIRSHIGFCPDCHSMKSPKFRPHTFQEIAYKNELSKKEGTYHPESTKDAALLRRPDYIDDCFEYGCQWISSIR